MQIPVWPQATERDEELIRAVLKSPQWGGFHPFVAEFEVRFAEFQQARYGIAGANGTVTLEAMLITLGVGAGDEVIVPAISFVTTAMAVSRVGAVPVFADIGRDTYNLDPEAVRAAISPRTKAVMAVHFAGAMCEMDRLQAICDEAELLLLEDAAHAHGAEWNGQRAGSFGAVSSFSFQNGKTLTAGEGGMLLTADDAMATRLRSFINCGRTGGRSFYEHNILGTNFRMTGWQAAVLLAQLERLPMQIARRTENVRLLKEMLSGATDLVWQEVPEAVTQHPWYLVVGRLREGGQSRRDRFARGVSEAGVPVTAFYPHTLYGNPLYAGSGAVASRLEPCPEAEGRVRDGFWFPHRLFLGDERLMEQVAGAIRAAL